jgi:ABC-type Fe3+-hydroxamate transport system substrate-binding protein
MKQCLLLLIGLAFMTSGCVRHYNITLSNNNVISTRGKPKFDKATGTYQFKDANGRPSSVPAFRIKEIAPQ